MATALVTGASSGIGQAIYQYLKTVCAERFDHVLGVSRRGPDLKVDLRSVEEVTSLSNEIDDLTCLVNCAGTLQLDEWHQAGWKHARRYDNRWDATFDVNFWAPVILCHRFEEQLKRNDGCVINVASVSGLTGNPDIPIYGASKAALIAFTKSLAVGWAPLARVNAISPGFVDTPLISEPTPQEFLAGIPMRYEAVPEMILPAVLMILDSDYMTGANIVIDGGLTCKVG